jgi:hypothetical protein
VRRRAAASAKTAPANPYPGARARQFNLRLLDPLEDHYEQLARELADQGIKTSVTEMPHAIMHEGPKDADEARALLQRWRTLNSSL